MSGTPTLYCAMCILLVIIMGIRVHGYSLTDVKYLRQHLFVNQSYDTRYRPLHDQDQTVLLNISLFMLSLNELDITQETMTVTGYLEVNWNDELLVWDPNQYGGLYSYQWPQDDVWTPVLSVRNSNSVYKPFGDSSLNVFSDHTGSITWITFQVFKTTCSMKVTYYPFDVQTCSLKLAALGYTPSQVYFGDSIFDLLEYEPNSQWEITNSHSSVVIGDNDYSLVFTLTLKRIPTYVLFTVLLPILMLVILNLFVFLLPCESGERVGYAVTVFLSFAVFFTVISSILPESVALFSVYVITMTCQSVLICSIAIVQVRLSHRDEQVHPVPKWLETVAKLGNCSFQRPRKKVTSKVSQLDSSEANLHEQEDMTKRDISTINNEESDGKVSWKSVISGTDYVLTALFTILATVITSVCIGVCASSR